MSYYEYRILRELRKWQKEMQRPPSFINRVTTRAKHRINRIIPEKVHRIITEGIKQMIRVVILGAGLTTFQKTKQLSIENIEINIQKRIKFYRSAAATEGALTGYGGILLSFADFPLWLSIKMKMLFEIASHYGYDIKDYKERIYILHIFQLTFSSQKHRNMVYKLLANWENQEGLLPDDLNQFNWRTFQLEYRDYIDLAKLLQLIPGFGAFVGAYINYRLTNTLGYNAMNAYRMRKYGKIK